MEIALTIGIMLIVEGIIMLIRDDGPFTILDELEGKHYLIIGFTIIVNILVHILLK